MAVVSTKSQSSVKTLDWSPIYHLRARRFEAVGQPRHFDGILVGFNFEAAYDSLIVAASKLEAAKLLDRSLYVQDLLCRLRGTATWEPYLAAFEC